MIFVVEETISWTAFNPPGAGFDSLLPEGCNNLPSYDGRGDKQNTFLLCFEFLSVAFATILPAFP